MADRLTRIGWVMFLVLVGAAALELTVRLDDWAQFGVPFGAPETSLDELSVRDSLGMHARAGTQFRQFRINSWGFRGPEVPQPLPTDAILLVTTGASETFGLYERAGGEWPQQLQASLAAQCRQPIIVLNAAFAGMSLPTVRQDIQKRILPRHPRAVLYYPTPMQYIGDQLPTAAAPLLAPVAPPSPWRSRARPRFRDAIKRAVPLPLLDLVRVVDTKRTRAQAKVEARSTVPIDRLDAFDSDLRALVGDVKRAGVEPVLVIHRNRFAEVTSAESQRFLRAWERFYPLYTGAAIRTFDDLAGERTQKVGADSGVLVVDPLTALRASIIPVFNDFTHFNDAGAALVGAEVARKLAPQLCQDGRSSSAPAR